MLEGGWSWRGEKASWLNRLWTAVSATVQINFGGEWLLTRFVLGQRSSDRRLLCGATGIRDLQYVTTPAYI